MWSGTTRSKGSSKKDSKKKTSSSSKKSSKVKRSGLFVKNKKAKKIRVARSVHTPWGISGLLSTRTNFNYWLEGLKKASDLMRSEGCIIYFMTLPVVMNQRILKHLKEVDPGGYRELIVARQKTMRKKSLAKKVKPPKPMKRKDVTALVKIGELDVKDLSMVKYIPIEGIRNVLAICLASGYTKEEVAAQVGVTVPELNGIVTDKSIANARRVLPEVIMAMADGKVLRDLMEGDITENTARADMIAARRRKTFIDQNQEGRNDRKDHEALEEQRDERHKERFGVDRKKGKVIDIEEEE